MRPGDFSPGNVPPHLHHPLARLGFNEAGGFLPRKQVAAIGTWYLGSESFNEAGGFLPRKLTSK